MGKTLGINLQEVADDAEQAAEESEDSDVSDSGDDAVDTDNNDEIVTADELMQELDDDSSDVMTPEEFKRKFGSVEVHTLNENVLCKMLTRAFGKHSEAMLKSLNKESLVKMVNELIK